MSTESDPGEGRGTRILRLADVRAIRGPAAQVIELEGSSCDLELAVGQRYSIEAHEWAWQVRCVRVQPHATGKSCERVPQSSCAHRRQSSGRVSWVQ